MQSKDPAAAAAVCAKGPSPASFSLRSIIASADLADVDLGFET